MSEVCVTTGGAIDDHGPLAHQFEDLEQQREADELGMWLFLATEVMFFGGMFLAYIIYRMQNEAGFAAGSHHLDATLGGINTAVLLSSSLSMALAVHAAQHSRRGALVVLLGLTMVLGCVFLGIKFYEYHHKYEEQLVPGMAAYWRLGNNYERIFLNLYFVMTGVHAVHMVIGIGMLITLLVIALRGGMTGPRSTPVHMVGLYWHFVDIVWVYLFPFLYLVSS